MNFEEKIGLEVQRQLKDSRFVSLQKHGDLVGTGRRFFVMPTSKTNYTQFAEDHPDYKSGDGVAAIKTVCNTLDEANNALTANQGDVVYVAEGHTETLSDATSWNLDVAGVTYKGLGEGDNRPQITLDTVTTATIPVSAANITIENMIFIADFADIVAFFTLANAQNFKLKNCSFRASEADKNALYVVDTNAVTDNASGLTIEGCDWIEPDTATESMVKMDGDNSRITLRNNFVQLGVNNNTPALMAIITGKSVFNAVIEGNKVYRLNTDTATGAILVTTDQSDNSGIICNNFAQHADTAAELLITASSGFGVFNNYASGVAGASGYILPGVDS